MKRLALFISATVTASAWAATPNALFSDHMVLQRQMPLPVWGTGEDGEQVTVEFAGQSASTTAKGGKWIVRLAPVEAGSPGEMTIRGKNTIVLKDVAVGEVWICSGQSNMQWSVSQSADPEATIKNSTNANLRLFTVPRQATAEPLSTVNAKWEVAGPNTVKDFTAVGYAFGLELQKKLGVAVGLINTSYGGTPAEAWTSKGTLESVPTLKYLVEKGKKEDVNSSQRATGLYNAMIAPLLPYAIRGAIWYQGESNAGRAYEYKTLFPYMIFDWRNSWGQGDFPFLFVQLAPFMKIETAPSESAWAELREAQRKTLTAIPNTAMAVITDLGDEKDIHPKQKAPVGARLALAARALAYGESTPNERMEVVTGRRGRATQRQVPSSDPIIYSGPEYDSLSIEGDKAIVRFKSVGGGLVAKDGALKGFTIAGADKKFYPATATISGDSVIVSSDKVPKPVAVRFGWANYPVVNLWNADGLPASPFRTDDFPFTTMPKDAK